MKKVFTIIALVLIIGNNVYSEDSKKIMTRADVIEKLSASDFLKKKIGDLFNWNVGYDITKINRTNLAPTLSFIKITPIKVPPDNRTIVLITAKVTDPSGPDNISGVRADLSGIKKLPNMMLVDNGLYGDRVAGDQVYTLQTNVGYDVPSGDKDIPVAVSNKMGWVALGKTDVNVQLNPIISEAKATPQYAKADGVSKVTLSAKVDNPGRQEDLRQVTIDLRSIGMDNNVQMKSTGGNTYSITVTVKPGTSVGVKKLPVYADNIYDGKTNGEILLEVQ
jgi:hypothetical protein